MIKKKPYKQFEKPMHLTQETTVIGVSVKEWHEAFTSDFEAKLKDGNELMDVLKQAPEK